MDILGNGRGGQVGRCARSKAGVVFLAEETQALSSSFVRHRAFCVDEPQPPDVPWKARTRKSENLTKEVNDNLDLLATTTHNPRTCSMRVLLQVVASPIVRYIRVDVISPKLLGMN